MRRALPFLAGAICLSAALHTSASAQSELPVELALVLAIDVSASVDAREYDLQIGGIAGAFRDAEVIAAIENLGGRGIAVALIQWDERARSQVSLPFHRIVNERSAKAFGFLVTLVPRKAKSGSTAIGSAIEFAMRLLDTSGIAGSRRVIDISGDGRSNAEPHPEPLRDLAVAQGHTINGLAVLTDDLELDAYYEASVIGGRGAFVEVAKDYFAFAAAFRQKLLREILPPLSEAPAQMVPAAWRPRDGVPAQ
jgi:hypothetical protein